MVRSDSTGNRRILQKMNFQLLLLTWQACPVPFFINMASIRSPPYIYPSDRLNKIIQYNWNRLYWKCLPYDMAHIISDWYGPYHMARDRHVQVIWPVWYGPYENLNLKWKACYETGVIFLAELLTPSYLSILA